MKPLNKVLNKQVGLRSESKPTLQNALSLMLQTTIFNGKKLLKLCGHYGFEPTRSMPNHPWSKGKVENPFDYLEDHFIKERSYDSFFELVDKLFGFQLEVNTKKHRTTQSTPEQLWNIEKQFLAELPKLNTLEFVSG